MFSQMKSRRSSLPASPCCCGEVCPCHQSPKETIGDIAWVVCLVILAFSPLVIIGYFVSKYNEQHPIYPTLNIKGEICQIHLIADGGTPVVHSRYQLVCPSGVYQ
jgi:hypothetical protein